MDLHKDYHGYSNSFIRLRKHKNSYTTGKPLRQINYPSFPLHAQAFLVLYCKGTPCHCFRNLCRACCSNLKHKTAVLPC